MIKDFGDKDLERCWRNGKCRRVRADLRDRVIRKLDLLDAATCLDDLRNPPSNHLHELHGEWAGYLAISVNGPWRIVFQYDGEHAYGVQLVQYH